MRRIPDERLADEYWPCGQKLDAACLEFLPAALELREQPPSPLGRATLWVLLALFVTALAWSAIGSVDIVVTASGRVMPGERVNDVQAPQAGTLSELLAAQGGLVYRGDPLARLDTTQVIAEKTRLQSQLNEAVTETLWRERLANWLQSAGEASALDTLPRTKEGRRAGEILIEQIAKHSAVVLGREQELAAIAAELDAADAERRRVDATLAVLSQRVDIYQSLLDKQYGARVQYLELVQQKTELEQSIPAIAAREAGLRAKARALDTAIAAYLSDGRSENLRALGLLRSEIARLTQDLRKVSYIEDHHTIRAPVTGTVEELQIHTIGGVLQAGQTLMKIVPQGVHVEVEALLQNKDIGFVREGDRAEVKIDTFNFTRYGVIPATILDIGEDAIEDDDGAWKYRVRLGLDQQDLGLGGVRLQLSPGMTARVEVRTGTRKIIEFLLAPLLRYARESLRER